METNNPYQAPSADVAVESQAELNLHDPVGRPIGQGWRWIADAFALFKQNIGTWIGIAVIYMVILIVLSLIPIVSLLTTFLGPVFMGGIMVAAYKSDGGSGPEIGDLFAGFKTKFGSLFLLGVLMLVLMIVLFIVGGLLAYLVGGSELAGMFQGMSSGAGPDPAMMGTMFAVVGLFFVALWIPLMMAIWFAPALVILNDQAPFAAMKNSFMGCLKNILPFFWYGIIAMVFAVLASIPLALGWLILGPIMFITMYTSYKAIYID